MLGSMIRSQAQRKTRPFRARIPAAPVSGGDNMALRGQKLFIIGGSSGIGKATALAAIESGAHVIIAGRTEQKLSAAQTEIGGKLDLVVLDVRDSRELDASFEKSGGFDHLIVTAAEDFDAHFIECDIDDARKVFETKFWGQFAAVQRSLPFINERGSITLLSGTAGRRITKGKSVIAAANGAVEGLVRSLAVELSPIRVNGIAPGDILPEDAGDEERKELSGILPVHRAGSAADIAHAVLFLVENQYVTGTVLCVDGGHVLT